MAPSHKALGWLHRQHRRNLAVHISQIAREIHMTLWHALAGTVAIVVITYAVAIWLLRKALDDLGDLF